MLARNRSVGSVPEGRLTIAQHSSAGKTATSRDVFVPEGRLTIAQHFSAGKAAKTERFLVPEGRLKGNFEGRLSIVPPGQIDFHRSTDPAINRWAIVHGPSGASRRGLPFATALALIALVLPAVSRADGAENTAVKSSTIVSLDAPDWLVAHDPKNVGRQEQWWLAPRADAKRVRVPGIFQEALGDCHGVAWYWRDFAAPLNPHAESRYLIRFWMVDYLADVWLNGVHVGRHEGGEEAFVFDVTKAIKPGAANRLAVRVLNPTSQAIEGMALRLVPGRNKIDHATIGNDYNFGGIVDSVELLVTPAVRVEDLFVRPDWKNTAATPSRATSSIRESGMR